MTSSTPIDGEDSALSQDLACSFSRMQTSPTPEESKLPQELVDIIIDYLGDEKDTLSACCLVSRRWVPSARVHLFREVHISFHAYMRRYRLKRLQGTAEESSLEAPSFSHVVESFVQFTANASPWLVANIKALYITGGRWGGPFSPYASMPFEYVEQLLRNIPSLLKLSLLDMQMPWDDHPVPTEFFPLRSLILRFPGSSTPIQPVLSILAMVPDLEDLRWYPTARQGSDRALKARHHIERIEDPRFWNKLRKLATTISDGSMPYDDFLGVVGRVFPQGRQIPLEELEVGIPNVSSFELVAGLVTIFHPTIQKLTITPSFISSDRRQYVPRRSVVKADLSYPTRKPTDRSRALHKTQRIVSELARTYRIRYWRQTVPAILVPSPTGRPVCGESARQTREVCCRLPGRHGHDQGDEVIRGLSYPVCSSRTRLTAVSEAWDFP